MLSFNTLSLLTTAALVTFVTAAPHGLLPVIGDANVAVVGPLVSGPVIGDIEPAVGNAVAHQPRSVVDDIVAAAIKPSVPEIPKSRSEARTLPAIILDASARITPVTDKINGIISADVSVKVDILVPLLDEIKAILEDIVSEVQYLVAHPIEGVLELAGQVLNIAGIAKIVAALVTLVVTILAAVLKVVAIADVHVIAPLVADIGALLATLLGAVFTIVEGLLPVLLGLIGSLIPTILNLNIACLLQILGIAL